MLLEVACVQRPQAGTKWPVSAALPRYGLLLLLSLVFLSRREVYRWM
jgi:hypothetical protein